MASSSASVGFRVTAVVVLALLLCTAPSCKGSSDTPIDSLVSYNITGQVTDNAGAPMAGVTLVLNGVHVVTGADGGFILPDNAGGVTGELTPSSTGITFLPENRPIVVGNADINGMNFTGFALAGLQEEMPTTAEAGTLITIQLKAVDAVGSALNGFTTGGGTITSNPSGMVVLTAPQFVDGQCTAVVRFAAQGTYTISLQGFCELLDTTLGTIQVGPGTPQPELVFVETWKSGAEAAISLTFDDGTEDHWSRGMALWADYGFRVTLGILANRFLDHPERIPQLQEAFDAGHELANHSTTHPDLTTQTPAVLLNEIQSCNDLLLNNVEGLDHVLTFIYPYETYNDDVIETLQGQGYLFARSGAQEMTEMTALNDPWNPPTYHLYAWANLNTMPQQLWDDTTDAVLEDGGWLVEECHGIGAIGETGVGWSPRPESDFRTHYDHIASFGDRIWVAPVSEVGRYLVERNCAQFTITENTADRITFVLATGLDGNIYDIPLSLWLEKPAAWTTLSVTQNAAALPFTVTEEGLVRFSVVPGTSAVSVAKIS
jgi:peptidoglycan/xylan/chitin deacetylase (PgdA/CDA1 family)